MLAMEKGFRSSDHGSETPSSQLDKYEVILDLQEDPQELPLFRRWLAVLTICVGSVCVSSASAAVRHLSFCSIPSRHIFVHSD